MSRFKIKYPHYYVPPCPECGSRCTGRYMRHPIMEAWYVEEQSLKNGEIVRFVPKEPVKNCFCVDCDFEWGYMVYARMLTREELNAEIAERGTAEAYEELHKINVSKIKKRKKNPFVKVFHWVFG